MHVLQDHASNSKKDSEQDNQSGKSGKSSKAKTPISNLLVDLRK